MMQQHLELKRQETKPRSFDAESLIFKNAGLGRTASLAQKRHEDSHRLQRQDEALALSSSRQTKHDGQEQLLIEKGDLSSSREKCRASINCPNSGALIPIFETKIQLVIKARSAANQACNIIDVPSTWTQQELKDHIRCLYGYSPTETLVVTLGGKQLREPHARLCDGKVSRYGLLQHESVSLLGGSDKGEEDKQVELPPIMQVLRHGLLNLNMQRKEEEDEEEQKDDNSEMDFIATLVDNKTKPGEETKTIQQKKQSSAIEPEPSCNGEFDEEEFRKLDNKIKEGQATEEEDN